MYSRFHDCQSWVAEFWTLADSLQHPKVLCPWGCVTLPNIIRWQTCRNSPYQCWMLAQPKPWACSQVWAGVAHWQVLVTPHGAEFGLLAMAHRLCSLQYSSSCLWCWSSLVQNPLAVKINAFTRTEGRWSTIWSVPQVWTTPSYFSTICVCNPQPPFLPCLDFFLFPYITVQKAVHCPSFFFPSHHSPPPAHLRLTQSSREQSQFTAMFIFQRVGHIGQHCSGNAAVGSCFPFIHM